MPRGLRIFLSGLFLALIVFAYFKFLNLFINIFNTECCLLISIAGFIVGAYMEKGSVEEQNLIEQIRADDIKRNERIAQTIREFEATYVPYDEGDGNENY